MPSHHDSNTTTDIKMERLSGVKTGNGIPYDKYNVRGIAHVRTNRKDDIFMQRLLVQSIVRRRSDYCPHGTIFSEVRPRLKYEFKVEDKTRPKPDQSSNTRTRLINLKFKNLFETRSLAPAC